MTALNCANCKATLSASDKFCPSCGTPVPNVPLTTKSCTNCGKENPIDSVFCESCGTKFGATPENDTSHTENPKGVPRGNYSGKLSTGKSKLMKRLIIAAICIVVVVGIGLIIWFQVDNNAEEKLKEALRIPGAILLIGFVIYAMITGKSKKRRRRGGGGYRNVNDDNYDDNYDNDYDDDGDWGDDGGGDDD